MRKNLPKSQTKMKQFLVDFLTDEFEFQSVYKGL
jgi:hypothetical protein